MRGKIKNKLIFTLSVLLLAAHLSWFNASYYDLYHTIIELSIFKETELDCFQNNMNTEIYILGLPDLFEGDGSANFGGSIQYYSFKKINPQKKACLYRKESSYEYTVVINNKLYKIINQNNQIIIDNSSLPKFSNADGYGMLILKSYNGLRRFIYISYLLLFITLLFIIVLFYNLISFGKYLINEKPYKYSNSKDYVFTSLANLTVSIVFFMAMIIFESLVLYVLNSYRLDFGFILFKLHLN